MPEYNKNINIILSKEDVALMISKAQIRRDKFLVAILYLTGARPAELLELKREDIVIADGYMNIKLVTKKIEGNTKGFNINDRILEISITAPFAEHITAFIEGREGLLIRMTGSRIRQIINTLSDDKFCPYHFRHSRMWKLMQAGASASELMYYKGARSLRSVEPYIRGKPIGRKLVIE